MTKRRVRKVKFVMKGGNDNVTGAPEGILSNKMILPSSQFESTGTGGDTSKYETAVSVKTGGLRRSTKNKRLSKKRRTVKKWFGLF